MRHSNPDLTVGADNKQRWNQPKHRRNGFHNAHRIFRRALMVRSREVLELEAAFLNLPAAVPALRRFIENPAFSAFCCLKGESIIYEAAAADFSVTHPHSIQSVTKMHIHLIYGRLLAEGLISLDAKVSEYLPEIGNGYAEAKISALLDMAVCNDFSEDYADPDSDCYTEEIALGWRLPPPGTAETTLREFACGITGFDPVPVGTFADYKSANTDVLTLVADAVSPKPLARLIEEISDAAGYEGAFHISLSPEHLPAFSGGGCLSARDLARFGLLFARPGAKAGYPDQAFLKASLSNEGPCLEPPRDWLKYSRHLMTDGRFIGHAGYGGQFLLVDTEHEIACAFLSVLENDAGYDDGYMSELVLALKRVAESLT